MSVINEKVTVINLSGCGLAFLAVCYYNHLKLQALKSNDNQPKYLSSAADANDEGEGLIMTSGRFSIRDSEPVEKNQTQASGLGI